MQLHQLKSIHKNKKSKRIGRGGKTGTYSGRGMKGQKSRAGSKSKPRLGFAGGDTLPYKKIPKRRGFKFKPLQKKPEVVINIGRLDKFFKDNDKVNPEILFKKGLIKKVRGILPKVKLLGGDQSKAEKLTKKLLVEGCQMSKSVEAVVKNVSNSKNSRVNKVKLKK